MRKGEENRREKKTKETRANSTAVSCECFSMLSPKSQYSFAETRVSLQIMLYFYYSLFLTCAGFLYDDEVRE